MALVSPFPSPGSSVGIALYNGNVGYRSGGSSSSKRSKKKRKSPNKLTLARFLTFRYWG